MWGVHEVNFVQTDIFSRFPHRCCEAVYEEGYHGAPQAEDKEIQGIKPSYDEVRECFWAAVG